MKLSCSSTHAPTVLPVLLPALEQSGYTRFWATEHYSRTQSGSPAVLMMMAALLTHELRIGAAGFMLRTRAPAAIVSDVRLLLQFFAGRIDVGVIGGAPPPALTARLLEGRPFPTPAQLLARFQELLDLLHHRHVGDLDSRLLGPSEDDAVPDVWMCSGSEAAIRYAAERGCGFAYHDTILGRRPELVAQYRRWYRPTEAAPAPRVVVAVTMCVDDDGAAARRAVSQLDPPVFAGDFEEAHAHLSQLFEVYGCDELALTLKTETEAALPAAYTRIAQRAQLPPRAPVE